MAFGSIHQGVSPWRPGRSSRMPVPGQSLSARPAGSTGTEAGSITGSRRSAPSTSWFSVEFHFTDGAEDEPDTGTLFPEHRQPPLLVGRCLDAEVSRRRVRRGGHQELLDSILENLEKNFRAHMIERELARTHTFETAIAAVVSVSQKKSLARKWTSLRWVTLSTTSMWAEPRRSSNPSWKQSNSPSPLRSPVRGPGSP